MVVGVLQAVEFCLIVVLTLFGALFGIELTFELPDNQNQCYYEDIKKGTDCTIEFQV